ncbi:MAG: hypothetical protein ACP5UT_15265 [Bryobacteraceae bacterium]
MSWWRRLFRRAAPAPLRGTPTVRRQKNYSAATGYAYEYFYEGFRDEGGCRRHYFTVSADRKTWFELEVAVEDRAIEAWAARHGRPLADNERYAIAKMALFEAFDERPRPDGMQAPVRVDAAAAERLLARLGIDA